MRCRLPALLAAGLLGAGLSACSTSPEDEQPGVASPLDPGSAAPAEAAGRLDGTTCVNLREFARQMAELQVSAEANHQLDQGDVERIPAPVEEVRTEVSPQFQAAVTVLERVANVAVMPMTDQAALDEAFAAEDAGRAMDTVDATMQEGCAE